VFEDPDQPRLFRGPPAESGLSLQCGKPRLLNHVLCFMPITYAAEGISVKALSIPFSPANWISVTIFLLD
jgi:hypothetical protein